MQVFPVETVSSIVNQLILFAEANIPVIISLIALAVSILFVVRWFNQWWTEYDIDSGTYRWQRHKRYNK